MINILDKQDCCGCSACIQVCPKQCITMLEDKEGFLYPQVKHMIVLIVIYVRKYVLFCILENLGSL